MTHGAAQVDFLGAVLEDGGTIADVRFSMRRDPISGPAPTYALTLLQHGMRSLQELTWTPELERFMLFNRRQPLARFDEEAERFATILLNNIQHAERHGAIDESALVLVDLLRRGRYPLQDALARIGPLPEVRCTECERFLATSLDGLFNTAQRLGYGGEPATRLMTAAIEIVLEELFRPPVVPAMAGTA